MLIVLQPVGASGFGQRTARGGFDPDTKADQQYLATSVDIAERVSRHLISGYALTSLQAVRFADGEIRPEQKFYQIEFEQAARTLAEQFPQVTYDAWLITLKNGMGYRLTQIVACRYGYTMDPVTRRCLRVEEEPAPPLDRRPEEEAPPLIPTPAIREEEPVIQITEEEAGFKMPLWAWGLGAGVAVALLSGIGKRSV